MPINPSSSSSSASSSSTSAVLQHIQSHRDVPVEQLFTRLDIVGKGAYGAVYKGIHKATGTILALKVINLDTAEDDIIEIQREVALLSQLRDSDRHNCIGYHGCYFYQTELWIAMDFASGGSIRTLLKPGRIEEKYTQLIIRETLIGLNYLHRQDIIHRDIKSANILLTNSHRVLLCDFGIAAPLQSNNHKRSTFIGTPYWMAPEVIADGRLYDTKADIWSLGITLYEMLNGNPPYSDLTPAKVILKIPRSQPAKLEGNQFSNGVKEFLAACLIDEPNDRPTAEELLKHKWIKSISKAPLTPLKDLTNRYSRWVNCGGVRQSLAGALSDSTARPESMAVDKSDWDFMDDANPEGDMYHDSADGTNGEESDDWSTPKDGSITVRPNHQQPHLTRPARPHRLMKLFEEDPENLTPPMGMFGGYASPFQHSPHAPVSSPNPPMPMIGLGFQIPGLPGAGHFAGSGEGMTMEVSTPVISIPTAEELDLFIEMPNTTPNTNPNRPFSPAGLNRSTTPTPTNYQRISPSPLINTNLSSMGHPNKTLPSASPLLTPTIGNHPFGSRVNLDYAQDSPDTMIGSSTPDGPSVSPNPGLASNGPVSTSPSLPVVLRKNSTPGSSSSRSRANTAPATQDATPMSSASNTPAMPSSRPTLGAASGKQFGGNGFSFGAPSSANTTPTLASTASMNNGHSPSPYFNGSVISPERERGYKPTPAIGSLYHHPTPPLPSGTRTRSGTENASPHPLSVSVSAFSQSGVPATTPGSSSSVGSMTIKGHQIGSSASPSNSLNKAIRWPTGVMKPRELNYHQLVGVKDVKNELEGTLNELSKWLESCEVGLGMLIEAMK